MCFWAAGWSGQVHWRQVVREEHSRNTFWSKVFQLLRCLVGDIQGIAGKTLQEIDGIEFKALDDGEKPSLQVIGCKPA
jgi:hypothetical protein